MRIVCDTEPVLQDLDAYYRDVVKRIGHMVTTFAYNVTLSASRNTPLGDQEAIERGEGPYYNFYAKRLLERGIEIAPGFHAGAWKFSRTNTFTFDANIYTEEEAAGRVRQDVRAEYKPGRRVFYIGAKGPAYAQLDNGYSPKAPEGIMQPTIADIQNIYSLDLASYYKGMQ